MVKLKSFLGFLLSLMLTEAIIAGPGEVLDRPLMFGPQYPLLFISTAYEPDTAFLLPEGELFLQTAYSVANTWGYSANAVRDDNGVSFKDSDAKGYSVYFDGEFERRVIKLHYGLNDSW